MNEKRIEEIQASTNAIYQWSLSLLEQLHLPAPLTVFINMSILSIALVILVYLSQQLAKWLLTSFMRKTSKKFEFAGYLVKNRFPHYLAMILPFSLVKASIPIIFESFPSLMNILLKGTDIYLALYIVWLIMSFIRSGGEMFSARPALADKPLNSFIQVIKILLYFIAAIVIISILTSKSPTALLTGLGAMSAVLMLVFKDTILGFVASIQLSANNMVNIGDWITVHNQAADGTVLKISLTTVKVQNFDNTIVTVPTYALISGSFQNWRGMQETGKRRIKRSIRIKQSSIRYLKDEELPKFMEIQGIRHYVEERSTEIAAHNKAIAADRRLMVNGRNLTNIGLFRKYVEWYLRNHPMISKTATLMVRQLEPTPTGLPLELYVFADTTVWINYEEIMADIFDHITASVPYFELEIFEDLSSVTFLRKE